MTEPIPMAVRVALFRELVHALNASRPRRKGWERSIIGDRTISYIVHFDKALDALRLIREIDWREVGDDENMASLVLANAELGLRALVDSMRKHERNMI